MRSLSDAFSFSRIAYCCAAKPIRSRRIAAEPCSVMSFSIPPKISIPFPYALTLELSGGAAVRLERDVRFCPHYLDCFLPFASTNAANAASEITYQSLPLFGDQRMPLGLTRM